MKSKPQPPSDLILYQTEDGRTRLQVRLEGETVWLEEGLWPQAAELEQAGHKVALDEQTYPFGGGQTILVNEEGTLVGGSDPRKDGYAAGF